MAGDPRRPRRHRRADAVRRGRPPDHGRRRGARLRPVGRRVGQGVAAARSQRPARDDGRQGGGRRRRPLGLRPRADRRARRLGDRRLPDHPRAARHHARARLVAGGAALLPCHARRHRERRDRHDARHPGPELRALLGLRDRRARDRRGRRAAAARWRRRRRRGRGGGVSASAAARGLHDDEGPRHARAPASRSRPPHAPSTPRATASSAPRAPPSSCSSRSTRRSRAGRASTPR